MEKIKCENCGVYITKNNYKKHYLSKNCLIPRPIYIHKVNIDLKCVFCNKQFNSNSSVKNHQLRCSENKERIKIPINLKGNGGKNQYTKAKELGLPKPKISLETIEKQRKASLGRTHSDETKKLISEKRIEYLNNNPDKVPYLLNHSSKISYPEQYFINCFKNYTNIVFQVRVGRYSLDFANKNNKIYFEVDGETHYSNLKTIEIDKRRSIFLKEKGWTEYRVRWKDFQKLNSIEKQNYVSSIIDKLK